MRPLALNLILGLTLVACTSAPVPEQPTEAEWVPCGGHALYQGEASYARCIKHVAILAQAQAGEER